VEPEAPPVVEETPQDAPVIEEAVTPRPDSVRVPTLDPSVLHPACMGWERTDTGTIRWKPNKVTPVLAGMPFRPSPRRWTDEPAWSHPSYLGWQGTYVPRDLSHFDPAKESLVHAGMELERCVFSFSLHLSSVSPLTHPPRLRQKAH
jgi:hypothetical protein